MRDVFLGRTAEGELVFLPERVRATHMQVIGASGTGKTKFLEHLIREDILENRGVCLLDPTGNLYRDLVRWCETKGFFDRKKIFLFDPASDTWSCGFNPLGFAHEDRRDLSFHVDAMVRACAAVWGGEDTDKTPLLKRCLRLIFHALAEHRLTLVEALELLSASDPDGLRKYLTSDISDVVVWKQWQDFGMLRPREFLDTFGSASNRLFEFLASDRIRRILGQRERVLDLRAMMDEGMVLLVSLSSGRRISEQNASLLGALLVNDLFLKARGRPKGSRPFYLYIDECSRFISEDVGRILDEGRQFGLHLILAHQHLPQLKKAGEAVYGAVMTDARTKVVFGGLMPDDAKTMGEMVFMEEFDLEEAKESLTKPVVVGYHRELVNQQSDAVGGNESTSQGTSQVTSERKSTSNTKRGDEEVETKGIDSGWGSSTNEGTSKGSSWNHADVVSEISVPTLEDRPGGLFSLEEQKHRAAARIRNLRTRLCIVKIPNQMSKEIGVPRIEQAVANDDRVARFQERSFERTHYANRIEEAEREIRERRAYLLSRKCEAESAAETTQEEEGFLE